jgi:hypothetical protein
MAIEMQVGGQTSTVRPSIVVGATPDYSDGDSVGGLITLSGATRGVGKSGLFHRFELRNKLSGGILVQTFVHIFDANPSATTFTDNGALSINSADYSKILKTITIPAASWVTAKGASPWATCELIGNTGIVEFLGFQTLSGSDMYFAIETDGTINFAAVDDMAAVVTYFGD